MLTILLATYNSEKYIREQIDSLLWQTYTDWHLLVRDDLSSDKTTDILNEYVSRYPDKISILENQGISKRAYLNFIELLKSAESEYYAFCDHDDVWLPDKLEICMQRMKEVEKPGLPVIVHTDMKVVDRKLNLIDDSFWGYSHLLPECTSFEEMVLCNSANGCTMLFNQEAKRISLPNVEYAMMHDMLLNQSVAAAGGVISAIEEPTVLYRQHIDNVVGARKRDFRYQLKKFASLRNVLRQNYCDWDRSRHIKQYSLLTYCWVKMKIACRKVKKYKKF